MARMSAGTPVVTRLDAGVYRVETDGRSEIVYVAGPPHDCWAFCNGRTFRNVTLPDAPDRNRRARTHHVAQSLAAPMPATVIKVLVSPGATVAKGDTVLVLEAMKMELPLRAPADATVVAVNCREGELVQPDTVLVELE
jgi:3-methylcrotonyl-CoA carboxylase alpha subunit